MWAEKRLLTELFLIWLAQSRFFKGFLGFQLALLMYIYFLLSLHSLLLVKCLPSVQS